MSESQQFTSADWDRLVGEYVESVRHWVQLGLMTPAEADVHLAEFFHTAADQRPRAAFRERWRSIDGHLAEGKISENDAERLRREIRDDAAAFGLGDPPC